MNYAVKLGIGMVVASFAQMAMSQNKPPLQNIQAAQQKVAQVSNHLNNVVLGGGGQQGGGQHRPHIPRNPEGGGWHNGPRFHGGFVPENDGAAQLAALGMSAATQELGNLLLTLAANYYAPNFFFLHKKACQKSLGVLIANQGAKVAAALPQVGFIQPQFFDMYDVELVQTRQLLFCPL